MSKRDRNRTVQSALSARWALWPGAFRPGPGKLTALGALLLAIPAAAPAAPSACVDASVCRSATTADSPRQLVLLPTPARITVGADGKPGWTIPVLGWINSPIATERNECKGLVARLSREALSLLTKKGAEAPGHPAGSSPSASRLAGFFVDNLCNQRVQLSVTGSAPAGLTMPPQTLQPAPEDPFCQTLLLMPDEKAAAKLMPVSDHGGLFCGKLTLSPEQVQQLSPQGQPLQLQAEVVTEGAAGKSPTRARAEAFLIHDVDSQVSIISDIDDTVRISHVWSKRELLQGTFFEPFRATPGLAQLFDRWQQHSPGLTLHFVSSSPLPLYKPLREELMAKHPFPLATYHLKWFRVSEGETIELLAKSPLLTKKRQIAPLLASYPHRHWALVGDSGEKDPEVYTNLLVDKMVTPERVAGIFIRDVTCDAQGGRTCRQRRFHDAFKAFADALKPLGQPVAEAAWRKWCVFYGGEDAAAAAAVPPLSTPDLAALRDADRPTQCWPHSQAEFSAVVGAGPAALPPTLAPRPSANY